MDPAIRIEKLWKEYVLGGARRSETLYETLGEALRAPFRRFRELAGTDRERERFWALRDLSVEVPEGEVLGVIGRNGAGKSTLLKILTRITDPTRGRVEIRGRVSSLLEVGTGFHPELTGRENIYLNGAILGMTRREIARRFDEIVAFAEIEKFLETPVKRYSSGMYVRLAFAVAAHLEPDVLLVDEVLAVGDAAFQRKCLSKMGDVRQEGRTILFVSHNMTAIQSLCSRAAWVDAGTLRELGAPREVIGAYLAQSRDLAFDRRWESPAEAPGNERVRIRAMRARPLTPAGPHGFDLDTPIELAFEYWNLVEGAALNLSLVVHDEQGQAAFNTVPLRESAWHGKPFPRGLYRSSCVIPPRLLNNGIYTVELLVVRDMSDVVYRNEQALAFSVEDVPEPTSAWHGGWPGAVRPLLEWRTEQLLEAHYADQAD